MKGKMEASTLSIILIVSLVVLFSGVGILLILLHQRNKKKAKRSLSWPETKGTVIKSEVVVEESVFGSDEQGQSQPMYTADISYTYQVDDMLYTSDRISFAGKTSYSKPDKAEMIVAKYPDGSNVSVFYDQSNPKEAILERSAKGSGVLLVAGVIFLVIGLISLVVGIVLLL
jgi:hypothetical protein